jgi:hypothetical protein
VRWQVYGAGPRLAWEWAAATVLAVVLVALATGVVINCIWRVKEGPWLEIRGMMGLANRSKKMRELEVYEKKGLRVYVRASGSEDVRITEDKDDGKELRMRARYIDRKAERELE